MSMMNSRVARVKLTPVPVKDTWPQRIPQHMFGSWSTRGRGPIRRLNSTMYELYPVYSVITMFLPEVLRDHQ